MAVSLACTASVNDSTVVTEVPVTVILPIVNSGSTPTNITAVIPDVIPTGNPNYERNKGAFSISSINFGPNSNNAVGANSTVYVTYTVNFHASSKGILSSGTGTYTVGATIYSSDGSVTTASTTTVSVSYAVSYPASQQ